MQKENDNKWNFLSGLTYDRKLENVVGLAGELTELAEVNNICGLSFSGYLGKIETPRLNGTVDEVVVAIEKDTAIMQGGIAFESGAIPGSRLLISGKMQTLKDFGSGWVLVFILADFVALSPKAMLQNDVALVGELAYKPNYRETPRGKRITDIFIKVQNVLTAGICYIPCICWQEQADEVAGWQQGDKVKLLGRYQSREYVKHIEIQTGDGLEVTKETRVAYELSVQQIKKAD